MIDAGTEIIAALASRGLPDLRNQLDGRRRADVLWYVETAPPLWAEARVWESVNRLAEGRGIPGRARRWSDWRRQRGSRLLDGGP